MSNKTIKKLVEFGAGDLFLQESPKTIRVLDRNALFEACRRQFAVRRIQKAWDACLSDPYHYIGARRLAQEYSQITSQNNCPEVTEAYSFYKNKCNGLSIAPFITVRTVKYKQIYGDPDEAEENIYYFRNGMFRPFHSGYTKKIKELLSQAG